LSETAELRAEQSSVKVALCAKRAEFTTICHAPRGQKKCLVLDLEVRLGVAQSKTKFCNQSFLFRLWRNLEAIIFNNILTYDKLK